MRPRLLNHPHDAACVLFHVIVLAMYAVAFWTWHEREALGIDPGAESIAYGLGAALLLGWCSGIEVGVNFHNHAHRRVFRSPALNRWFARTWTVSAGWPAWFWRYAHVTVHHRHLLQDRDWTLPRRRKNGEWENFFVYCLAHWPWRYAAHLWRELRPPVATRAIALRARNELIVFLALFSIPFWFDPVAALFLWVLPAWLANVLVVAPGMYAQHAGREAPSDAHTYRHSNVFRSRLFNLLMFNIGYHAEHHTYPWVHWSDLPELHQQIAGDLEGDGAHVVPFGYYRAGLLLSRAALGDERRREDWERGRNSRVGGAVEGASAMSPQPPTRGRSIAAASSGKGSA